MIARVLAAFRLPRSPSGAKAGAARPAAPSRHRRNSARAAVWSGAAAFLALTLAMAAALDAARPEWRDPEFALKLNQLRRWQADSPHRPLVVAFGSSRTQMALSPAAMGFPDEPGSPLVYNFGYQGAQPVGMWLQFARVLDSGVKPAAVLVQLAPAELLVRQPAEREVAAWAPRLSPGDVRRLAPLTENPTSLRHAWVENRLNPWATYREAVRSDLLPDWQTERQRKLFVWEQTDEYGFAPHTMLAMPAARRKQLEREVPAKHENALKRFKPGTTQSLAFRGLVARCRAEGIPVAFFWSPTSPMYRSWFSPASRAAVEKYGRELAAELGVDVFPEPEHLEELDFADGFHMLPHGAPKYSRWLADTHLKPWLAARGLAK